MTDKNQSPKLDLSAVNVRARSALQRLKVETIEQLLSLTRADLSLVNNCGRKTIAAILKLQQAHGKEPEKPQEKEQETAAVSPITAWEYMSRLIVIAIVARDVVEGVSEQDRNYVRVTKRRINSLRRALQELKNPQSSSIG